MDLSTLRWPPVSIVPDRTKRQFVPTRDRYVIVPSAEAVKEEIEEIRDVRAELSPSEEKEQRISEAPERTSQAVAAASVPDFCDVIKKTKTRTKKQEEEEEEEKRDSIRSVPATNVGSSNNHKRKRNGVGGNVFKESRSKKFNKTSKGRTIFS